MVGREDLVCVGASWTPTHGLAHSLTLDLSLSVSHLTDTININTNLPPSRMLITDKFYIVCISLGVSKGLVSP